MDYALLESHRQHFRESYNLAKAAVQESKERKAKAYLSLALEHCQFVIDNSIDADERKRYRALREKCKSIMSGECESLKSSDLCRGTEENEDKEKGDIETSEGKDNHVVVIKPEHISVEEALRRLDELIGLDEVKQQVHDWIKQIKVFKLRRARGIKVPEISYHMVFMGNPGTGKTTVARLLAQIYRTLGISKPGSV